MQINIRLRLIVFTFCIVFLVAGGASLYSVYLGWQHILTTFEKEAREITTLLARVVTNDLYFLHIDSLRRRLQAAELNRDIRHAYVLDLEGLVLTDGTEENTLQDQHRTDPFSKAMLLADGWISTREHGELKIAGPIVMADGTRIGYLQVSFALDRPHHIVQETIRANGYLTMVCLGVGAVLAVLLGTSFSRPVMALVQAAQAIGKGKLETRVRLDRGDEFGLLAKAINQMAGNLTATTVSKTFLDNIIKSMDDTLIATDIHATITMMNAAAIGMLGYEEGELIGKPLTIIFPEENLSIGSFIDDFIHNAPLKHRETICRAKDGRPIPVFLSCAVLRDVDNQIQGGVWMAQDLTQRKQAEAALQDSEAYTRLVLENALDAIVTMDARGLISDWNPQAEAMFGWSRAEAKGRSLAETIIPLSFREAHRCGLQHFLATGEGPVFNQRIETKALHRDGHAFLVESTVSPLRLGQTFIFSVFLRDITERKRAEAELQQAKEAAEDANRAKSAFLANMSHELRTPLHGILSFASFGLEKATTATPKKLHDYFQKIDQSGRTLLALLNDLLDLAKLEAGKTTFENQRVDLRDLLARVADEFSSLTANRGLTIRFLPIRE